MEKYAIRLILEKKISGLSVQNFNSMGQLVAEKIKFLFKTRPDTRPIPVADGWAGAEMRVFTLSNSITTVRPTNQPTNQPNDQRTDGRTKPLIESLVRD